MKKTVETVVVLGECPNCGAERVGSETSCRICNTSLIESTVAKETFESKKPEVVFRSIETKDSAEIVSNVRPVTWRDSLGLFFLMGMMIVLGSMFLVFAHRADTEYKELENEKSAEYEVYSLLGMKEAMQEDHMRSLQEQSKRYKTGAIAVFGVSVLFLAMAVIPMIRYKRVLNNGQELVGTAEFVTKTLRNNMYNRYKIDVRYYVVFSTSIDGCMTTVAAQIPRGYCPEDYPAGRRVAFRKLGKGIAICD